VPVVAFAAAGFLALTSLTRRARPLRAAATPAARLAAARSTLAGLEPWWRHYGGAKLRLDPVYRQLAEATGPWGRTLDLGCGPGLCAALAAARGDVSAYVGIDLDRDKLLAARRLLGGAGVDLGGVWRLAEARLPLSSAQAAALPGPFDTVLLIDVLHYWPVAVATVGAGAGAGAARARRPAVSARWRRRRERRCRAGGRGERFTTFFALNHGGNGLHFVSGKVMGEMLATSGFTVESQGPSGGENQLWRCQVDSARAANS